MRVRVRKHFQRWNFQFFSLHRLDSVCANFIMLLLAQNTATTFVWVLFTIARKKIEERELGARVECHDKCSFSLSVSSVANHRFLILVIVCDHRAYSTSECHILMQWHRKKCKNLHLQNIIYICELMPVKIIINGEFFLVNSNVKFWWNLADMCVLDKVECIMVLPFFSISPFLTAMNWWQ